MIDASKIPEPSRDTIIDLVREGTTHSQYGRVVNRADKMKAWYNAQEYESTLSGFTKSEIIRKSPIESQQDYNDKLENFDLIPFEHKFFQTQQRIYDENNVQRTYPDGSKEFWANKEAHFDDQGDEIDVFYRDKVLFVKEIEGFGAICMDLAMNNENELISDGKGKSVPYPYITQASEVKNYNTWYGHLQYLITAVQKGDKEEWRAFTPNYFYVFKDQQAEPTIIPHKFGRTPAILLKGAVDSNAGFKTGMPRRWNLTGLYLAASELFYDLKQGSALFGHPIPAMPMSMIRQIAGAYNEDKDEFNSNVIKEKMGYVVLYPDENPPSKLFYQADMQGLQHLRQVIFEDLINLIYQIAQVRDKSKIVHNASGRSKQFDSVEEQGLLAQTATDMEAIEKDVQSLMASVRGEEIDDFNTVYSKHHDLSSADEIWGQYMEALQYGGVPTETLSYLNSEFLRKRSAPSAVQEAAKKEIKDNGFPLSSIQLDALKDRVDDAILIYKARPELGDPSHLESLQESLQTIKTQLPENGQLETNNQNS